MDSSTKTFTFTYSRDMRPDAQAFDEIRIVTVPRYKESELSGDEWRIGANVQLLRKGRVMFEATRADVEWAAKTLMEIWERACSEGAAYYAGEGDFCDQEGCSEKATVAYKKKKNWCSQCGKSSEIIGGDKIRCFCDRHKRRGDCGLDDSDNNYELLPNLPTP